MEIPHSEQLAYLAGAIDGDGWISITGQGALTIGMGMVRPEAVAAFAETFSGKFNVQPSGGSTSDWCICVLTSHKAADAIRLLYPFLRVKKRQAQVGLEYYDNKPPRIQTDDDREFRDACISMIRQLNRKPGKKRVVH